uniref:Uncharacterized protein n=1 Tax=Nothobranchius furzeri TaxID=105023 RepID=A0A8C6M0L1_NOTFU
MSKMLYTELLQLWNESVQLVDARDWLGALEKLQQISEPTSRTHFNAASAHLALGQLEMALKVCSPTVSQVAVFKYIVVIHVEDCKTVIFDSLILANNKNTSHGYVAALLVACNFV